MLVGFPLYYRKEIQGLSKNAFPIRTIKLTQNFTISAHLHKYGLNIHIQQCDDH